MTPSPAYDAGTSPWRNPPRGRDLELREFISGDSVLDQVDQADGHDFLPARGGVGLIAASGRQGAQQELRLCAPSGRGGVGEDAVGRIPALEKSDQRCGPLLPQPGGDAAALLAETALGGHPLEVP